VMLPDLGR